MLLKRQRALRAAKIFIDGLIAAASMFLAGAICSGFGAFWPRDALGSAPGFEEIYRLAGLAAVFTPFVLRRFEAYQGPASRSSKRSLRLLLPGTLMGVALVILSSLFFDLSGLGIGVVGLYVALQLAGLAAVRRTGSAALRAARRLGYMARTVIVVGSGPQAQQLALQAAATTGLGVRIVGFLDDAPRLRDLEILGPRYLGKTKELSDLVCHEVIDEVMVALPRHSLGDESVVELIAVCEAIGVDVTVVSDPLPTQRMRPVLHGLLGRPGLTLTNYPHRSLWALAVKRIVDILGAVFGILVTLPLCLVVALLIKLDSRGPVFFVQRRSGLRGRTFPFLKFRTMYTDAEARLEVLLSHNEVSGPVFKIKNDPRVTELGKTLRKYSIDELPQLLNVLVGQMSLVGPRPPIPNEVGHYELGERRRLSVLPGLTCIWQVSGRSLIAFDEWVRLDLEYIDAWSLPLDLKLLAQTVPAVLSTRGAS